MKELDELIDLIEKFKLRTRNIVNNEKTAVLEKKLQWIILLLWTTSRV